MKIKEKDLHKYHGEFYAWLNMLNKCYNPAHPDFEKEGGRGIEVCNRWKFSFLNFINDMGPAPTQNPELN